MAFRLVRSPPPSILKHAPRPESANESSPTGNGRQRERCPVHRAGSRPPNGSIRQRREHYPRREHERQHYEQGTRLVFTRSGVRAPNNRTRRWRGSASCDASRLLTYSRLLTPCPARHCARAGSRMGVVQHVQVRGAADGAQHGLRAGPEAHPRQHPQPGSHLHKVRSKLTYVASFVPSPACARLCCGNGTVDCCGRGHMNAVCPPIRRPHRQRRNAKKSTGPDASVINALP